MGKKSKTSEYPTTTLKTGLYGTSTSGKSGTTYKPTKLQKQLVGVTNKNAVSSLNNYLNPNYESADYKQGDEYYTNKMYNNLQNNYLAPALQRNLLRGSSANDIMRGFASDMASSEYERQQDYKDQQLQNYMAAMLPYTTIYDMMQGSTGLSNSLANSLATYNLNKNKNGGSGIGNILGNVNSIMGSASSMMNR